MNKRAFAIVDIIIILTVLGMFAASFVPKLMKELEIRELITAEHILTAVNKEQESRCNFSKHYTLKPSQLTSLNSSTVSKFDYVLIPNGIRAVSKKGYELRIPSYSDGRICCFAENSASNVCKKLGRAYPTCGDLELRADFSLPDPECEEMATGKKGKKRGKTCTVPKEQKEPMVQTDEAGCQVTTTYQFNDFPQICAWEPATITRTACPDNPEKTTVTNVELTVPVINCKEEETRNTSCVCGQESGEICVDGAWETFIGGACELTAEERETCQCEVKPQAHVCAACGEAIEPLCDNVTGKWFAPDPAQCKPAEACVVKQMESCSLNCAICSKFYKHFLCNENAAYSVQKAEKISAEQGGSASLSYIADVCCVENAGKNGFRVQRNDNLTALLDSGHVYRGTVSGDACHLKANGPRVPACPSSKRELAELCSKCDPASNTCSTTCYDRNSFDFMRSIVAVDPVTVHGCEVGHILNGKERIWLSWPAPGGSGKCFAQSAGYTGGENKQILCPSGFPVSLGALASECDSCTGLSHEVPAVLGCEGPSSSVAEYTMLCVTPAYEKVSGYSCQKITEE